MNKEIMPMPCYAEYTDSGATLTELLLPEHWRIEKCRFLFRFNKGLESAEF